MRENVWIRGRKWDGSGVVHDETESDGDRAVDIIERSITDQTLMSASESNGRAVGTPGRRIQIKIMGNISG